MLTTYLGYFALFFAGYLAASVFRGKRDDEAAANHLLRRAVARFVAAVNQDRGEPTVVVSRAAIEELRQALAAQRELDAG